MPHRAPKVMIRRPCDTLIRAPHTHARKRGSATGPLSLALPRLWGFVWGDRGLHRCRCAEGSRVGTCGGDGRGLRGRRGDGSPVLGSLAQHKRVSDRGGAAPRPESMSSLGGMQTFVAG